jgi:hypothetical protein
VSEKISLNEFLGLKKPTEKMRKEFSKEELAKRKKQPQSWMKQKYRKYATIRENTFRKKAAKAKADYIEDEKEIKNELAMGWKSNKRKT